MDVNAYLSRIGLGGSPSLRELHRAHLTTVPFENLSIHLGEPVSLDGGDLFDKIVRRRRGGFCYELNGAFALLLEEMGHTVTRLAARVFGDEGRLGPPYDHLALVVDGQWLVDVGFGSHSTYPLRFDSRDGQADPAGVFALADTAEGDIDVLQDGQPRYRLERRERVLEDFAATCWYQQTFPESHFRKGPVCTRLDGDGRITLSGRMLIRTTGAERTEEKLGEDGEVLAAYRDLFGVSLDRVPGL